MPLTFLASAELWFVGHWSTGFPRACLSDQQNDTVSKAFYLPHHAGVNIFLALPQLLVYSSFTSQFSVLRTVSAEQRPGERP